MPVRLYGPPKRVPIGDGMGMVMNCKDRLVRAGSTLEIRSAQMIERIQQARLVSMAESNRLKYVLGMLAV